MGKDKLFSVIETRDVGVTIKSARELEFMRQAGSVVARTINKLTKELRPGMTTSDLDDIAVNEIKNMGAKPSFKGYLGFPRTICTSINNEIVHGIPGARIIQDGDLVKMDKDRDLYFIARKDQMIKTAGYRVSPTEIEEEFLEIKNIKHVLAFGIKDESLGQIIFIVYATFNKKKIPENLLISHVKKRLPTYMIPKKFIFKKIFPTTGNQGKIDRKKILINYLKND